MTKSAWIFAASLACLGFAAVPAVAGDSGSVGARSTSNAPVQPSAVPDRLEVEAVVLSAMAAAADQARENPGDRSRRGVSPTTAELRTAMLAGARREVSRRWPGTVYIPETPDVDAFKICFGRFCFDVQIDVHIKSL